MESNTFWRVALLFVLLAAATHQYVKNEDFRGFVDNNCPWIKEQLAKHDIKFGEPTSSDSDAGKTASSKAAVSGSANPVKPVATPVAPNSASMADLPRIAANPALWPKVLRLKKTTEFSVIFWGKEVGKTSMPIGAEVRLIELRGNQVAIACGNEKPKDNSSGKWIPVQDTDLLDRVRLTP